MKKILIIILIFATILSLMIVSAYYYSEKILVRKIHIIDEKIITIPKGTSLGQAVTIMNQKGIFQPEWFFELYMKVFSKLTKKHIFAGSYNIKPDMTNRDVMESIFSGNNLFILHITYPEGITLKRFAEITANKLGINKEKFLRVVNSPQMLKSRGINVNSAEGYLMPDTYEFYFNPKLEEIINQLFEAQDNVWNTKFARKAKEIGLTRHEVLTLASIIEAESPNPSERPKISGVYHNRLKIGMLLQADPTVQYAIGKKKRLLYKDLEINNPYNTYKFPGLPPGPINSPSQSSIDAALNPENHNFIFFVAKGDGSMLHNFSRNHSEHLSYVAKYRRNIKKN